MGWVNTLLHVFMVLIEGEWKDDEPHKPSKYTDAFGLSHEGEIHLC